MHAALVIDNEKRVFSRVPNDSITFAYEKMTWLVTIVNSLSKSVWFFEVNNQYLLKIKTILKISRDVCDKHNMQLMNRTTF